MHERTNGDLTFILMMSVTQLTCASLLSQQKCLRSESSVTQTFHLVSFAPESADWTWRATPAVLHR